jgi:translocation and assembly module TamB
LDLFNLDAARLVAPFPGLAGRVEGPVDVSLRLGGDRELRGTGRVALARGRVLGIEVADCRIPFDLSFIPGVGGRLNVWESSARVARGRALGKASLTWGDSVRLEGSLRFFDSELREFFGPDSGVRGYASGRLGGSIEFGSNDLRSADDLDATFRATLSQAQPMGLPVLQQIVPFLGLAGSGSTQFQSGEVQGRLSHGIARLQRCTLTSPAVQLILEGNVSLSGVVDLDVTAGSGNFCFNSRGIQILGLRLPDLGPLPLALVVDASALLANRLVHLRVTGTYRNPVIQVVPTSLLSQEAVRFFLSRTVFPTSR